MATSTVISLPVRRHSPEQSAARAHAVLDAALSVHDRWAGCNMAAQASADLDDALDEYHAVESGALHWEAAYPHLAGEQDPHGEALMKLAEEACMAMAILLMTIAATAGRELADAIKDTANENGPQISPAGRAECASADDTPHTQGVHQ